MADSRKPPNGGRHNVETIRVREGEEFDLEAAERYLRERIEGLPGGELEVRQFPSGASNLTYLLKVGEWEGVLRRPPLGPIPPKAHEIEGVESLTDWLVQDIPESPAPTIIHNDYKLNNLVLNPEDLTEVRAVLDWEMATVGDPLFDLAESLSYWTEPTDPEELKEVMPTVTSTPGFMTRAEFVGRYAEKSGRDLSEMHWYMVFGYFKLAVILQQIFARWKKGQTRDERFASFDWRVRTLILHANSLAEE